MKIFSFAEGANPRAGGMGLVGIPWICKSLADQGHHVILNLGGHATPGSEQFVCSNPAKALSEKSSFACFDTITYPAYGRWAFAPSMLRSLYRPVQDVDFIMLHSLYSFPVVAGYILSRWHKKPYGFWPHGVLAPVQRGVSSGKKAVYDQILARRIMREASVILYSSAQERDETCLPGSSSRSVVIPHGIDLVEYSRLPDRGSFRQKYLDGDESPLVLYLGRLNAKKGLDLLAQAMSQVVEIIPNTRLAIVGTGDPPAFINQVKGWLAENGISRSTVVTGLLDHAEKLSAFADSDVFVLPSHAENFGFAMFEAMSSRVPLVSSDTVDYASDVER